MFKIENKKLINRSNYYTLILGVLVFLTNLSQVPILNQNRYFKYFLLIIWIVIFFHFLWINLTISKEIILLGSVLILFDIYVLLCNIFLNIPFYYSPFFIPINMSILIFITGYFFGKEITNHFLRILSFFYVKSSIILAFFIYLNYFFNKDWLNVVGYLYPSKNSASFIFAISIIMLLLNLTKQNLVFKIFDISILSIVLIMLKSRATILSLIIVILFNFLKSHKKSKTSLFIIFSIFIFFILFNDIFFLFVDKIIFNNLKGNSLDVITSGRVEQINIFLRLIPSYLFFGNGNYYIESFPLSILISYGILGSIPVLILVLLPLYIIEFKRKIPNLSVLRNFVFLIFILSIFNSLFEQLTPFGPGVKSFMLWLSSGILASSVGDKGVVT